MSNALIIHGGGPTAVMNASLYGAVKEAGAHSGIGRFYAAIGGSGGLLRRNLLDLKTVSDAQLELLPYTPASAIGTSRDPLEAEDYARMAEIIRELGVGYVFFTGGNGSMEACGKIYEACRQAGTPVQVVGIPKTIDNDLQATDHAPGFGSAARYMAATVSEVCQDVRAMPIHVSVVEAMGRNAGWIAAASALARDAGFGPDLIYTPERPFEEEAFLTRVEALHRQRGGVVVVVSEGLKNQQGEPIVPPIFQVGRAVYYGDVSAHLAGLVIRRLGIKARGEKPGLCGRASIAFQSSLDREEAVWAGRAAVQAAIAGHTGVMVGFEREPGPAYAARTTLVPIERVMLRERTLPERYLDPCAPDVTQAFCDWCRPLIGGPLRPFVSLRDRV